MVGIASAIGRENAIESGTIVAVTEEAPSATRMLCAIEETKTENEIEKANEEEMIVSGTAKETDTTVTKARSEIEGATIGSESERGIEMINESDMTRTETARSDLGEKEISHILILF